MRLDLYQAETAVIAREQAADTLCISEWLITEFSSALSMKIRMDLLPPKERATGGQRAVAVNAPLLLKGGLPSRRATNRLSP
jgi:hypothetical protein